MMYQYDRFGQVDASAYIASYWHNIIYKVFVNIFVLWIVLHLANNSVQE